jgi:hypothetical protein
VKVMTRTVYILLQYVNSLCIFFPGTSKTTVLTPSKIGASGAKTRLFSRLLCCFEGRER